MLKNCPIYAMLRIANYALIIDPEKADKQGMPLTSLSPIPLKNVEFRDGMGLRLVNGIPCLSAFSGVDRGGHH